MLRFAVLDPAAAGANVTPTEQEPPTGSDAGHPLLATANSAAFTPLTAKLVSEMAVLPVFASDTVCGALVPFVSCVPNDSAVGVIVSGSTAVPVTLTTRGLPTWLSAIDSVAVRVPAAAGLNVNPTVHVLPGATAAVHPFTTAKSPGLVPASDAPLTVR